MHWTSSSIILFVGIHFLFALQGSESKPLPRQSTNDTGLVRHIVTFHFASNVSEELQLEVMEKYLALQYLCTNLTTGELYIVSQDGGFANSPEGLDQKMQQGYIVSFSSVEDRNYFVGRPFHFPYDPHHDAFKQFVKPFLNPDDGVFVFDFTVLNFD